MQHLIKLLPDNIANQIAAGEVVQRPASVVKELLENAVDAGADRIDLVIKDAGKALIQVIDNGSGMSVHDARMAFERHATSKIREADDLFNIRTMGFRGEALASIAAVAQVSVKTRLHDEELGTELQIDGSEIKKQEPVVTAAGTCFSVKNLFFNVPARRNFLKSNPVETRHILNEFLRVAIAHPELALSFEHNGTNVYQLDKTDEKGRLGQLFGSKTESGLIKIEEETPYLKIFGFVGEPKLARKARGDQYFFVNHRFIKSHYLNHAIRNAFGDLLPADKHPFYCVYLGIDPGHVDINIHPTKTEIKFDDEQTVYSLLLSVVKKGLARLHAQPELELDADDLADLLTQANQPTVNKEIRDFLAPPTDNQTSREIPKSFSSGGGRSYSTPKRKSAAGWDNLFFQEAEKKPSNPVGSGLMRGTGAQKAPEPEIEQSRLFQESNADSGKLKVQYLGKYILTESRTGLLVIDQFYAHQRVLYEKFLASTTDRNVASQQLLFPKTLRFAPSDMLIMRQIEAEIQKMGFDVKVFGQDAYMLHGIPSGLNANQVEKIFEEVIAELRERGEMQVEDKLRERLARSIAVYSAIPSGKKMSPAEVSKLVNDLLSCNHPGISPGGKPVFYTLENAELDRFFGR